MKILYHRIGGIRVGQLTSISVPPLFTDDAGWKPIPTKIKTLFYYLIFLCL